MTPTKVVRNWNTNIGNAALAHWQKGASVARMANQGIRAAAVARPFRAVTRLSPKRIYETQDGGVGR